MSRPDHVQRAMKALFGDYNPNAPKKEAKPEPKKAATKEPKQKQKPKLKKTATKEPKKVIIKVDEAQPILKHAYAREKDQKMTKKMSEDLLDYLKKTAPKKDTLAVMTSGSIKTADSGTMLKALPFLRDIEIRTPKQLTAYLKRNSFLDFGYGVLKLTSGVIAQDFFRVNKVFTDVDDTKYNVSLPNSQNFARVIGPQKEKDLADEIDLDDRAATSNVSKDEKVHYAVNAFKNLGHFDNAVGVSKDGKSIKKKSYQGAASDLGIQVHDKKTAGAKAARMLEESGSVVVGDTIWFSKKFLTAQANKAKDMVKAYVQSPPKLKPESNSPRGAASAEFDRTEKPIIVGNPLTAEDTEQLRTGEKPKFNMLELLNHSSSDEEGDDSGATGEETLEFGGPKW
jgi:hypothetical protein